LRNLGVINRKGLLRKPEKEQIMNTKIFKLLAVLVFAGFCSEITGASKPLTKKDKSDGSKEKSLNILTLGDSNGALPFGWPNQLKKIRTNDTIFNISISGNTIGFINNGQRSLNTLLNIESYMEKAYARLGKINRIIIMLGTNDCKAVFRDSLSVVPGNMKKLISEIKQISKLHKNKPVIYIVSPPPFGTDEMVGEKYIGGMDRVFQLNEQLKTVARSEGVIFINTCQILYPVFKLLTPDGVHLNADGQKMIALIIQENLKY
jgi:lysophospholipase L1-like esterase